MRALRFRVRTLMAAVGLMAVLFCSAMMGLRRTSITGSQQLQLSRALWRESTARVTGGQKSVPSAPTSAPVGREVSPGHVETLAAHRPRSPAPGAQAYLESNGGRPPNPTPSRNPSSPSREPLDAGSLDSVLSHGLYASEE